MNKSLKVLAIALCLSISLFGGLSVQAATKTTVKKTATSAFVWTADAKKLLNKVPAGVRPSVKKKTEAYAKRNGIKTITLKVMKSVRD
ncbi:MAG: PCP reductase family protein [Candidatus Falkowbacteria bacterium]|nr:PCP reductase family protein [Candidatus Falkowbacteria bacterium]